MNGRRQSHAEGVLVAKSAFRFKPVAPLIALGAWQGTVSEVQADAKVWAYREFWATTLFCPRIVAKTRFHALGLMPEGIAIVQYSAGRFPAGRKLRLYAWREVRVLDSHDKAWIPVQIGPELFQLGVEQIRTLEEFTARHAIEFGGSE